MSTFIKAGLWTKKKEGFKGELNLDQLITSIGGGDFIPLSGTEIGKPVTGSIELSETAELKFTNETYGDGILKYNQYGEFNMDRLLYVNSDISSSGNISANTESGFRLSDFRMNLEVPVGIERVLTFFDEAFTRKIFLATNRDFGSDVYIPLSINNQFADDSGNIELPISFPYKVYTAIINQTDEEEPKVKVLENTLGGPVIWTYNSVGDYTGTLANAFTTDKTVVFTTRGTSGGIVGTFFGSSPSTDTVRITTGIVDATPAAVLANNQLNNSQIEIRVYN